ncbi:MAG: hypothetical protein WKF59_14390 [Chitinophagaceae bacterium]
MVSIIFIAAGFAAPAVNCAGVALLFVISVLLNVSARLAVILLFLFTFCLNVVTKSIPFVVVLI